jgi:pyruvate,water dikinase
VDLNDPLHGLSDPATYWSTTNVAEAMPGVQTPLGWTVWAPICELGIRTAFAATGALPRNEVRVPSRPQDRTYNIFYGRAVLQVDFFFTIGNRVPGTDGAAVVKQWLDFVPPEFTAAPSRRRYPVIAARMPVSFSRLPARTRAIRTATQRWYDQEMPRVATMDADESRQAFTAATGHLMDTMGQQATTVLCGVQPVFDQLERLIAMAGGPTTGLLRGYGSHEETRVVADLWACSRDRMTIEQFQTRHGYHGPGSGELAATVWREDPKALVKLIESYRALRDDQDPRSANTPKSGNAGASKPNSSPACQPYSGPRRGRSLLSPTGTCRCAGWARWRSFKPSTCAARQPGATASTSPPPEYSSARTTSSS